MSNYAYVRVSTDQQEVENQLAIIRENYKIDAEFSDVASGYRKPCLKRPGFLSMWERLEAGDRIYVVSLSRIGRNLFDTVGIMEELDKKGVAVYSIREGVDTSTPTGRSIRNILFAVAEMERENISAATKEALKRARAEGKPIGKQKKYSDEQLKELWNSGRFKTQGEMAQYVGMTRASLNRRFSQAGMTVKRK